MFFLSRILFLCQNNVCEFKFNFNRFVTCMAKKHLDKNYELTLKEYRKLFNDLYVGLCFFATKYTKNELLSQDIVQEVFIKVWEKKITFKDKDSVKSFMYTSVKNKSLDLLKSSSYKNSRNSKDLKQIESESFFLREVVIVETSQIIENAINTLPKKCAEIIRLSLKEYSNIQIAEELSISINTVKTQKKIAYKKLRPLLKDYYIIIAFIFENQ